MLALQTSQKTNHIACTTHFSHINNKKLLLNCLKTILYYLLHHDSAYLQSNSIHILQKIQMYQCVYVNTKKKITCLLLLLRVYLKSTNKNMYITLTAIKYNHLLL
jgi:hypothetical protein